MFKNGMVHAGAWILALLVTVASVVHAQAADGDARKILKAMSDYLAAQKSISLTFDSDIEVLTSELQKIQFTSSGELHVLRPNKLMARHVGG